MASMRARVYFPAPAGPERMSEWGRRPALMAARRLSTAGALPRKWWKPAGSVGAGFMVRLISLRA
jgi:hypothetical protein